MLIKKSLRNLSVLVLIFVLSCAPLSGAKGRGRGSRRSKDNKTRKERLIESDSRAESGPGADSDKPEHRRRHKSKMRKDVRSRLSAAVRKARHRTKPDKNKKIVTRPHRPGRPAHRPAPVVRRSYSPMQAALININKRQNSFKRQLATRISPEIVYHDRPGLLRRRRRYEHIYRDRRARLCHRIVRPKFRFVSYRTGSGLTFGLCNPYYNRKYVFVSLGGRRPMHYRYRRYYWYGCHPDYWYGCYPVAQQIKGDTYNYYTYNYHGTDGTEQSASADAVEGLVQQPDKEPAAETMADRYFEQAVKAFEDNDYETAAERLAEAIELEGDDIILPFAYAQALFADRRYNKAAEALRLALAGVPPETQGIFYPRGLYAEDDILFEQIDTLAERADVHPADADLQLLLGYQLLGVGRIDDASGHLQQARRDPQNAPAAEILLELLEEIKTDTGG